MQKLMFFLFVLRPLPAVELLPEEQWRGPSTKLPTAAAGEEAEGGEADAPAEGAADGAHIAQVSWGVAQGWFSSLLDSSGSP